MNGRTDVQIDGKRKRELRATCQIGRDGGSEAGRASDFFFEKKETFESYWTLYKTDFKTGRNKQNKKYCCTIFQEQNRRLEEE